MVLNFDFSNLSRFFEQSSRVGLLKKCFNQKKTTKMSQMISYQRFELTSILDQPWATQIGPRAKFQLIRHVEGQNRNFSYSLLFQFRSRGRMKKLSTRFEVSASNFWVRNVKTSEVGTIPMIDYKFDNLSFFKKQKPKNTDGISQTKFQESLLHLLSTNYQNFY